MIILKKIKIKMQNIKVKYQKKIKMNFYKIIMMRIIKKK